VAVIAVKYTYFFSILITLFLFYFKLLNSEIKILKHKK